MSTKSRNLSVDEVFALQMKDEAQFQDWINARLGEEGWLNYHTFNSQHSPAGFLDNCAIHAPRLQLLFAELKVGARKPTPKQRAWLAALRGFAAVVNGAMKREVIVVRLWRPVHRKAILRTIRGTRG